MPQPPAEIVLRDEDVDRLLASQFPELRGPVRRVAHGWDNDLFRLGEHLAVRLPRRELAAALLATEQRWLAHVAPLLPVPVPVPLAHGRPEGDYPWPWSVVPWFPGHSAADVPAAVRDAIAEPLAHALRGLHVPAPADAPRNRFRGVPPADRAGEVLPALAYAPALRAAWDAALEAPPWNGVPVWVHGDAHPGNVVLTSRHRPALAALVDFGDLTAGDPACDLACAWLTFTDRGRRRFRDALAGTYDDATWVRARAWAAWFAHLLAGTGDPGLRRVGRHGLDQLEAAY